MQTKRIIASIFINVVLSIVLTLLLQGIVLLSPTQKIIGQRQVIEDRYRPDGSKETIITNLPAQTETMNSYLLIIVGALIAYPFLMIGIAKLSSALIPLKNTTTDWSLVTKITTATTAFFVSMAGILVPLIKYSHAPMTKSIKILLIAYPAIYLIVVGYSIFISRKRLKGIKKEEVFQ